MRRALTTLLATALLAGAALAQPAGGSREELDALLLRGQDHPRAALQALQALTPRPGDEGYHAYVERLLRVRSGEPFEGQVSPLPRDGAAAWLLRAAAARFEGRSQEGLAMSTRALERLQRQCPLPGGLPADAPAPDCELRYAYDAALLNGRGLRDQDELPEALAHLQAARELARRLRDPRREAQALADEAVLQLRRDEATLARQRVSEALGLAQGQPLVMARVQLVEAQLARAAGALDPQRRLLEQVLAVARQQDAPALLVLALGNLADHHLLANDPARARSAAETALQTEDAVPELRFESHLRHNLTVALIRQRAFEAARQQLALQAQLISRSQFPLRERAAQLRELDQAWTATGQWRDALAAYHAERELSAEANEREREASLAALRRENEAAERQADVVAARQEALLNARKLENQKRQKIVIVLAGVLLGLGLAVGLLLWIGSQAAHRRLRRSQARLQDLAERDALTGLANRRAFQLAMQARGEQPLAGALLMLDIDHFKQINDTHGHAAGDAVLQAVAQRLRAQVRASDMLVRWGGEEFLLYCPGMPAPTLRLLAQRLLRALEDSPVAVEGELALSVTASIGFAAWPLPPQQRDFGWEQAVNWVDLALYQAKQTGRARAVGIVSANLPDDEAVTRVEADFAGAANAARIELVTLRASQLSA